MGGRSETDLLLFSIRKVFFKEVFSESDAEYERNK